MPPLAGSLCNALIVGEGHSEFKALQARRCKQASAVTNSRARQALQGGTGYLFLVCPGGWTAARMEEWTARDEFWDLCDILAENGWNMPGDGVSYYILQDEGLIVIVL